MQKKIIRFFLRGKNKQILSLIYRLQVEVTDRCVVGSLVLYFQNKLGNDRWKGDGRFVLKRRRVTSLKIGSSFVIGELLPVGKGNILGFGVVGNGTMI